MAAIRKSSLPKGPLVRVSPLKPSLRGARNIAAAQFRAASLTKKAAIRFTAMCLLVLAVLTFLALWLGGFLPRIGEGITDFKRDRLMAAGFVVEQVDVMGEGRLNEADVRSAINIWPGDYFFDVDLKGAQARTESLPWVDRAVVRRLWPNRIVVQLVETSPYALWQNEGEVMLVSADGEPIAPMSDVQSMPDALKLWVGVDAPQYAPTLEASLRQYPDIWARTESLVHHHGERWDVHLEGGVVIKLPNGNWNGALAKLTALHARTTVLERQVVSIDLRLSDRITVQAAPATPA